MPLTLSLRFWPLWELQRSLQRCWWRPAVAGQAIVQGQKQGRKWCHLRNFCTTGERAQESKQARACGGRPAPYCQLLLQLLHPARPLRSCVASCKACLWQQVHLGACSSTLREGLLQYP